MSEEIRQRAYEIAEEVIAIVYSSGDRLIRYNERRRRLKELLAAEQTDDPVLLHQHVMRFLKSMQKRERSWHQSNSRLLR